MNTPDKCPHCGAGEYPDSSPRFHTRSAGKLPWLCGTLRDTVNPVRTGRCFENELINERAAHAATKRELELFQKDAAQKTYKESQSITADRKIAELEHDLFALKSKADRCETEMNKQSARANAAESRVRELEGLEITGTHYFSDFVGVAVTLPLGSTPTIGRTLGEAMPRKEGV